MERAGNVKSLRKRCKNDQEETPNARLILFFFVWLSFEFVNEFFFPLSFSYSIFVQLEFKAQIHLE